MRTNELRKQIRDTLLTIEGVREVYFQRADPDALYPHITFDFDRVSLSDLSRKDYMVYVDVWDKGDDNARAEDLADAVENLFNNENRPEDSILPTFFLESRRPLIDEDKSIRHKQIVFNTQLYEVS